MKLSDNVAINLPVLLESRLLVQANSGGGKSWAIRRLLEQTAPHVQQLVIDPEGEFATLRERFDYVIAAPHDGDAVATPKTAALLARRLLESGVSAILDIYDLKAHERQQFVKRFLDALINAPRALWHPVMVVVDEAHTFAPQNGSAEALPAVIDLATRGRKRGQCLVLATQRLSKLHKDAAAEMLNKLIGRTGLDVDVKRAADELGLTARDAMEQLRNLAPGEFYAFGPALSSTVVRTRIGEVRTTHPKPGSRMMQAPPKPSERVMASLAKLADLQREADHEAATVEELKADNAKLRREATIANKRAEQAGVPEAEVQRRIQNAQDAIRNANAVNNSWNNFPQIERIRELAGEIIRAANVADSLPLPDNLIRSKPSRQVVVRQPTVHAAPSAGLSGPEQRILDAIAWLESIGVTEPEQPAVAFLAGYTYGAGGFNNPKGRLNQTGMVEYQPGSRIRLTDAGRAAANAPTAPATTEELHDRVLAKLPGPEQRILRPLLDCYPKAMRKNDLAHAAGYTPGAGGFNNPCGRLRSLGLIDYPTKGMCAGRALLFPRSL
jgi:hypothetical protein